MVRRHHQLNGRELEQTPGDSEGQGSPPSFIQPWGRRVGRDLAPEQQPGRRQKKNIFRQKVKSSIKSRWSTIGTS